MSNLSVNTITDASGGSTASINGLTPQASNMQPHNLIINGAMTVAQRATSVAAIGDTSQYSTVDRWRHAKSGTITARFTESQDATGPSGFATSLKFLCTTANASPTSDIIQYIDQFIEAQNLQSLAFGTADAKTITLSFWVKSNVTGTYAANIQNEDASRLWTKTYSISSANTWEYKTLTFTGDASGAIANDNGRGFRLRLFLVAGTDWTTGSSTGWATASNATTAAGHAVNLASATNNYWQITGVQLEAGSTASSFAHEFVGDTLQKCQRYYTATRTFGFVHSCNSTVSAFAHVQFPVTMRSTPSISMTYTYGNFYVAGSGRTITAFTPQNIDPKGFQHHLQGSGFVSGNAGHLDANPNFYAADAEL